MQEKVQTRPIPCKHDHRDAVEARIEERRNDVAPIRGKLKKRDKRRARETAFDELVETLEQSFEMLEIHIIGQFEAIKGNVEVVNSKMKVCRSQMNSIKK